MDEKIYQIAAQIVQIYQTAYQRLLWMRLVFEVICELMPYVS